MRQLVFKQLPVIRRGRATGGELFIHAAFKGRFAVLACVFERVDGFLISLNTARQHGYIIGVFQAKQIHQRAHLVSFGQFVELFQKVQQSLLAVLRDVLF